MTSEKHSTRSVLSSGSTGGGVLVDEEIRHAIERGDLSVTPHDPALVRPSALGLRLGHEAFGLVSTGVVDIADRSSYPELCPKQIDDQGRLRIEPREVVLAPTLERIGLSERLAGLVDGTSSYARLGLSVVLSGQVSPGFGRTDNAVLTLEIVNHLQHAVLLYPGTRICNLMLFACSTSMTPYDMLPHSYGSDQAVTASRLADRVGTSR
jgi:dCTP deaminase